MSDDDFHSFIVRIWLEESATERTHPTWRGSLTHVISGRRVYFGDLKSLPSLMRPYLEAMLAELKLPEGE
ncbi:hypothetical protein [Caldilinea sp.]|uniref:hypothetical protein n=1 Tax=Caldilinea sp. TaxID=2293560 RepID=UPI002B62EFF2|nr:hypothetical protein [Anaerolineales bacterium]HQY94925.1 hypothetical protein [Caldilinea sp.]